MSSICVKEAIEEGCGKKVAKEGSGKWMGDFEVMLKSGPLREEIHRFLCFSSVVNSR